MPLPSRSPSPATRLAGLLQSPSLFSSYPPSPATHSVGPLLRSPPLFSGSLGADFGSLSRRPTPFIMGPGTRIPTPEEEFLSPQGSPVSGRSSLPSEFDPAINPGHLLPVFPPMWHEWDQTWRQLQSKLEAAAGAGRSAAGSNIVVPELGISQARGYSQVELEWVAGYLHQRRCSAGSAQFWETVAERFNDRFKAEKSGKTLRKWFRRVGRAPGVRRMRRGAGGVLPMEGVEFRE